MPQAETRTDPPSELREQAFAEIRRRIFAHLGGRAARVYLFGSCARGDWRQSSDVDVAVEPLEPVPDDLFPAIRDALEESDIPYFVDVVDWRRADPALRATILREGILWTRPGSA